MTGPDIAAPGPRLAPAPAGRKGAGETPPAKAAAPRAPEADARDGKDREADDFDAALKQEEKAADPAKPEAAKPEAARSEPTKTGTRKAARTETAEAESGTDAVPAPATDPTLLLAQPPAPPSTLPTDDAADAVAAVAAPATGASAPAQPAVPAGPAGLPAAPDAALAGRAAAGKPATETAAPGIESAAVKGEARSTRAAGDPAPAPAEVPRPQILDPADAPRPQTHAAAPAAPQAPAAADARVALPDPGAGGLTLAPAANVDWRLSAHAAAQAFPREAATQGATAQAVIGQITVAVGKTEDKRVEIRLDPPELGRVHIHLTPTEQGLQATVVAERPETHALLRRHGEALARDLGDAGFGNVSLDFAAGGRETPAEGDRRQSQAESFAAIATPATAAAAAAAAPIRAAGDGALDIRL